MRFFFALSGALLALPPGCSADEARLLRNNLFGGDESGGFLPNPSLVGDPSLVGAGFHPDPSISESNVNTFVDNLFVAIHEINPADPPADLGELAARLVAIDPSLGAPGDLGEAQASLQRAVDQVDSPVMSSFEMHLELIDDIEGSSSLLEMYKQDLINSPPQGLSSDELNSLILETNLDKSLNQMNYEVGHRNLGGLADLLGIPDWLVDLIKNVLEALGLAVEILDQFDAIGKCAKAWIKFISALIFCLLGKIWKCLSLPFKLRKIFKNCKKTPPPTPRPTCSPIDLCCGVWCPRYHNCHPGTGGCIYDQDADPCNPNPCPRDAICRNGDCNMF